MKRWIHSISQRFCEKALSAMRGGMALSLILGPSVGATDTVWTDRRREVLSRLVPNGTSPVVSVGTEAMDFLPSVDRSWGAKVLAPGGPVPWTEESHGSLPLWLKSTVGLYGDVQEVQLPSETPRRFVIHLQDVHGVENAQRRLAGLLEQLTSSLDGARVVGVEGASGPFNLGPYRRFTDPLSLRRAADVLLRRNVITGSEYFALTTQTDVRLWGVENPRLYRDNVRALRATFEHQVLDDRTVDRMNRTAVLLKKKLWSPALRAIDDKIAAADEGRLSLGELFAALSDGAADEEMGPETRRFRTILEAERTWDPARATAERNRLLERLSAALSPSESRGLMNAALERRLGRWTHERFHKTLSALLEAHGLTWDSVPAYAAYERSLLEAERLDGKRLIEELSVWSGVRCRALATDEAGRRLVALMEDLRLLRRLNTLTLSPEDVNRLRERRPEMEVIPERLAALAPSTGAPRRTVTLTDLIRRHLMFYTLVERRNTFLVEGVLRALGDPAGKTPAVALLVAGGYHSPGVRDAFLRQNVGYIALSPRFTDNTPSVSSLESFRPGASAVERFFARGRSELQNPLILAEHPLSSDTLDPRHVMAHTLIAATLAWRVADAVPWKPSGLVLFPDLPEDLLTSLRALVEHCRTAAAREWPGANVDVFFDRGSLAFLPSGGTRVRLPLEVTIDGHRVRRIARVDVPSGETADAVGDIVFDLPLSEGWSWMLDRWNRWGVAPARNLLTSLMGSRVSPWAAGLDDWMSQQAGFGARSSSWVGRVTWGIASFGWSQLNRAARWTKWGPLVDWTERRRLYLLQDEERRSVRLIARSFPAGIQNTFLVSLAQMHRSPLGDLWGKMIVETLGRLGPGVPPLSVSAAEFHSPVGEDPGRLSLSMNLGGRAWSVQVFSSKAPALYEGPVSHPLALGSLNRDGSLLRVYVQEPAFSDPDLLRLTLRHFFRETALMVQNPGLSHADAHAATRDIYEERLVALLLERLRWRETVQTFENGLLRGDLMDLRLSPGNGFPLGEPHVVPLSLVEAVESGDTSILSSIGVSRYLFASGGDEGTLLEDIQRLTDRLAALGVPEPRVWAEQWASTHLEEKSETLTRLAHYLEARDQPVGWFRWKTSEVEVRERLADFVLSLISSAGREAGQRSALSAGAPVVSPTDPLSSDGLKTVASLELMPLSRTVLAILSNEGVLTSASGAVARDAFAKDLVSLYAHAFQEGVRRALVLSTADVARSTKESTGLSVGVFHVQGRLADSSAARELLRALVVRQSQGTLATFAPVVLLDGVDREGDSISPIVMELQHLLSREFPALSEAARREIVDVLWGQIATVASSLLLVDDRLSLDKILHWVRGRWKDQRLAEVAVFTNDRERLRQDARDSLVDWVIFLIEPRGLMRLSDSLADMNTQERLRRVIASNA